MNPPSPLGMESEHTSRGRIDDSSFIVFLFLRPFSPPFSWQNRKQSSMERGMSCRSSTWTTPELQALEEEKKQEEEENEKESSILPREVCSLSFPRGDSSPALNLHLSRPDSPPDATTYYPLYTALALALALAPTPVPVV